MKAFLYYAVRKIFNQERRNKLKIWKYNLKKRMVPYYKKWHGVFKTEDLEKELITKLPHNFDVLMVHSSYSSMLPMYEGSISELLQMLIRIARNKTLVMPAFFFGARKYNYNVIEYYQDHPEFDIQKMPSQMGMITEMFRKYSGVKVSRHPTHRIAALGPMADELISNHEHCRTGCGNGSPFDTMTSKHTLVLGMGVHYYQSMTQTHATEDILFERGQYPTKFDVKTANVVLVDGKHRLQHELTILDKSPYQRRIHPLLQKVMGKDLMQWKFHGVPMYLASAAQVTKKLNEAALAGRSVFFPN